MIGIEDMQFMRLELQDTVGCGLEVIEQFNVRGANGMGQSQLLQRPGKMYRPALAIENGSSHAKATCPQCQLRLVFQKRHKHGFQRRVRATGMRRLSNQTNPIVYFFKECQYRPRPPNISGKNHIVPLTYATIPLRLSTDDADTSHGSPY